MYFVYVLRSGTSGRIYIGQTDSLKKRLEQHNDKTFSQKSFTKKAGSNWQIVYQEQYSTRKKALQREKYLKSHIGRDWLKTGPLAQW